MTTWKGCRVLVTGHTGFKGAWLTLWLQELGARVSGISLAPDPDGAFAVIGDWPELDHRTADVRHRDELLHLVGDIRPDLVFHLAAQAIVGDSWRGPAATFEVNVMGTVNLLEALSCRPTPPPVVVITTDKVYAPGPREPRKEGDPLGGDSPYAASKASAELVVASWPAAGQRVTTRAGNVVGGGDNARGRLVPDVIRSLAADQPVPVRHPEAVRPWQHVLDPLAGYLMVGERLLRAEEVPPALNFGPRDGDVTVAEVLELAISEAGRGEWRVAQSDVPETFELRIDSTLAEKSLGWRPRRTVRDAVRAALTWEQARGSGEDMRALARREIAAWGTW